MKEIVTWERPTTAFYRGVRLRAKEFGSRKGLLSWLWFWK